jgi:serine/threonine-protein kinase
MTFFTSRLAEALAGRYDIEREIGAGGMATAFLATDTRHGRRVAIKVLRPVLSIAFGAARFLAEIRTTANLLHPHILPLRDSGEVNGTIFCVIPYVEGPTLCDRIARAAHLPVDEAVRIAVEVADALQHAHPKGVWSTATSSRRTSSWRGTTRSSPTSASPSRTARTTTCG